MKRTVQFLAAAAAASLLSTSAFAQGKTGVIDLQKVFDGFWRTKQADTQIKDRLAEFEKMGQNMFEEYKKSNEEFGKQVEAANDPALSNDEKDKRRKELEKKRKDLVEMENNLKQFQQNSQKSLMEQKFRVRDSILREVRGVIEEKAKAGGYNTVLDVAAQSANQTPFVIYTTLVGGENDLSDTVSKALAATAPADALKTEEKKEEKK